MGKLKSHDAAKFFRSSGRVVRMRVQWNGVDPMKSLVLTNRARLLLAIAIGSVWVFHGLYSKILNGVPRHRMIVARMLGEEFAGPATIMIGGCEVLLGFWAFSGWNRRACALVQTLAIAGMNTLEILLAKDLLISAPGMVALNIVLLSLAWFWAASAPKKHGA